MRAWKGSFRLQILEFWLRWNSLGLELYISFESPCIVHTHLLYTLHRQDINDVSVGNR